MVMPDFGRQLKCTLGDVEMMNNCNLRTLNFSYCNSHGFYHFGFH